MAPTPGMPAPGGVDIGTSLSWAWSTFQANTAGWLTVGAIFLVINLLTNIVPRTTNSLTIDILFPLVGFVISQVALLNLVRMALGATRGEAPDAAKMFNFERIGGWIGASILFSIMFVIGFFLCCVPAVLVYLAFGFWGMVFVDQNLGVTESFSGSNALTKGRWGELFVFWIVIWAITFLIVSITCGLAAIVAYPVGYLAIAHVYKTMRGEAVVA